MAIKQVSSVQAAGPGGCPCGRSFTSLLGGNPLPATLTVTFDDASTLPLPITWLFGNYNSFDNVGQVIKLRGLIVLQNTVTTNELRNDRQIEASFTLTTTPKTGLLDPPVGADDVFCNRPGDSVGS